MAKNSDLTSKIERLEVFEERLEISFNALYASVNENGYLAVNGEIHPIQGTDLQQDLNVIVDVFDSSNRIISQSSYHVDADNFFGFESFSIFVGEVESQQVAKIRLYPKSY